MRKDNSRSEASCLKYAKELLVLIFKDRYVNLFVSDKPDLQDENGYGVEVTRAVNKKFEESLSAYQNRKLKNKSVISYCDCRIIQFQKESEETKLQQLREAYEKKIAILNRGEYKVSNDVDLLMFSSICDSNLELLLNDFSKIAQRNFRYVYIVGYKFFYEFDLTNRSYKKMSYVQNGIDLKAEANSRCRYFWF